MAAEGSGEIAGVEDETLAAVAGRSAALPNVRASRADRFAQAVRTLIEKRAQEEWPQEGAEDVAVFVLVDYPRKVGQTHGGTPFADPVAQGTPLLGRLFFASPDATRGQYISLPHKEAGAILEWLEDHELGDGPIVIVYRNAKEMVTRRCGTGDAARSEAIRDQEPVATIQELMDALSYFHRSRVVTPTRCPEGVWKPERASRYIPGPQPEKSIQLDLQVVLSSWFRGVVRAETEDVTNIGRIDVRLLTTGANGRLVYWVIIELKVIKSFSNTESRVTDAANVEAIVKGIRQAGAYRTNRNAEGMLEVYDLRDDKSEDLTARQNVSEALATYSVPPRVDVWPVYGSAADARAAGESGC